MGIYIRCLHYTAYDLVRRIRWGEILPLTTTETVPNVPTERSAATGRTYHYIDAYTGYDSQGIRSPIVVMRMLLSGIADVTNDCRVHFARMSALTAPVAPQIVYGTSAGPQQSTSVKRAHSSPAPPRAFLVGNPFKNSSWVPVMDTSFMHAAISSPTVNRVERGRPF